MNSPEKDPRIQEAEWRDRMYIARNEPVVETFVLLLRMQVERIKTSLLKCDMKEVEKLQGEASAYVRVLRWIHEPVNARIDNK